MCGIAGFVSFRKVRNVPFLSRASELLAHRGPDDEGYVFLHDEGGFSEAYGNSTSVSGSGNGMHAIGLLKESTFRAGLLHRRLAILNTGPAGHQPMHSESRRVWISYNGEIYNYRSLQSELEKKGYAFVRGGDTEVLLAAWLEWGPDCLEKLDGMWSFAILDLNRNLFFASTDRAGVKPFYYRCNPDGFFFASEIKALFDEDFPPEPNRKEAARFLARGLSDEGEATLFEGVFRLQGGHSLRIRLDHPAEPEKKQWHSLRVNATFENSDPENARDPLKAIKQSLLRTMASRLQSDVPVGICLSGGTDSSSVAGLVSTLEKNGGHPFPAKAFMAVVPAGVKPDESPFARLMAEKAGLELHTTCPDPEDFIASLPDLMYSLDAPAPGMNAFSQYALFRLVSGHGIKVSLDGQGADEIFAGYPSHLDQALWDYFLSGCVGQKPSGNFIRMLLGRLRELLPPSLEWSMLLRRKPEFSVFHKDLWLLAGPGPRPAESGLNGKLAFDFSSGILPFLLKAADRNSMRWSVESRMPFADSEELVNLLFSLPGSTKVADGRGKFLLREAVKDFVPEAILNRKDKVGFAAPDQAWLQALIRSGYGKSLPACPDFINEAELQKWSARYLLKPENIDSGVLWRAWSYKIWHTVFFSGNLQFGKRLSGNLV